MSNSGRIRRVNFRTHACQIVDLLAKSFDETLLIEGISFERNRKLAEKQSLLWLLDVFHPILARFGEVFVWDTQRRWLSPEQDSYLGTLILYTCLLTG